MAALLVGHVSRYAPSSRLALAAQLGRAVFEQRYRPARESLTELVSQEVSVEGDVRSVGRLLSEWLGSESAAREAGLLRADVNPTHVVAIFIHSCTQWFEVKSQHQHWEGMGSDAQYLDDFLAIFMDGLKPPPTTADQTL